MNLHDWQMNKKPLMLVFRSRPILLFTDQMLSNYPYKTKLIEWCLTLKVRRTRFTFVAYGTQTSF